jgi:hypothetical protein
MDIVCRRAVTFISVRVKSKIAEIKTALVLTSLSVRLSDAYNSYRSYKPAFNICIPCFVVNLN